MSIPLRSSADLSPEEFTNLAVSAANLVASHLAGLGDAKARTAVPESLRSAFLSAPLPVSGTAPQDILNEFEKNIMPFPMGNTSPRFFAWVNSPPLPIAPVADMLATAMNPSVAGGDHAAVYVEHCVLNWLREMIGIRSWKSGKGVLCSGGSVANIIGLAAMRHKKIPNVREEGMSGASGMRIYTSTQGHSCLEKAVDILGFGRKALRKIAVDSQGRMDLAALHTALSEDRAAGLKPICIAASAGTVNAGAIDPLDQLSRLCQEQDLWFHIDGSYGAMAAIVPSVAPLLKAFEQADSIATDQHKWAYVGVECGAAFVRDEANLRSTFSLVPEYLRDDAAMAWFSEYSIQQTRGFRALKVWMSIKHLGLEGYRTLVERDIGLAAYLRKRLLERKDEFELLASGPLSIVCFLCRPQGMSLEDAARLTKRVVLEAIQPEGTFFLTTTEVGGLPCARACIVNFRTTEADIDALLDAIAREGKRLVV